MILMPWLASSDFFPTYVADRYSDYYDLLARNLAAGNGYRFYEDTALTTLRAPGYPLLLAAIFSVFGETFAAVKLLNVIAVCAGAFILLKISSRFFPASRWQQLAPSLLLLLHPGVVLAESRGTFEASFMLLCITSLYLVIRGLEKDDRLNLFLGGLALGAACLFRSTPLLFPPLLAAYLVWSRRFDGRWKQALGHVAVLVLGLSIILSPWVIRNYRLTGEFIPTMTIVGMSSHHGQRICLNADVGSGRKKYDIEAYEEELQLVKQLGLEHRGAHTCCGPFFYSPKDEVKWSRFLSDRVISRYREKPSDLLRCVANNSLGFWVWGGSAMADRFNMVVQIPIAILFILGLVRTILQWPIPETVGVIALFVLYYIGSHLPLMASARMSIPAMPFIMIFLSAGAGWLAASLPRWTGRHNPQTESS
jgi:4-amino-4-deoxy-L-arabinose transferase-like glycosyltransferase